VVAVALLAVLLAISITVNLVILFCHLLLRRTHSTGAGRKRNVEQLYEEVAESQVGGEVVLKDNEAYGQRVHPPTHNSRL